MLVLVTMFVNINSNLPKTSYMKMVELWLIVTLIIPYVEVLIFTYKVIPGFILYMSVWLYHCNVKNDSTKYNPIWSKIYYIKVEI